MKRVIYEGAVTGCRRMMYEAVRGAVSAGMLASLVARSQARSMRHVPLPQRPRLAFVGTDFNQDGCGFLPSLAKEFDARIFYREDGRYGQHPAHSGGRFEGMRRNDAEIRRWLSACAEGGWTPDLVLMQTWNEAVHWTTWEWCRARFGSRLINIGMDDRHACLIGRLPGGGWRGTLGLARVLDLQATAAPEMTAPFAALGCRAEFWPEASDPGFYFPMDCQKDIDVLFVGQPYGMRGECIRMLRSQGIDVRAFGKGTEGGIVANEDVNELFNRSRIVLGFSNILQSRTWSALKLRDFDALMSGAVYVTSHNSDLETMFTVGRDLELFRSPEDLLAKVRSLLADPGRQSRMRIAGRQAVFSGHTWRHRFQALKSFFTHRPTCAY